MLGLSAKALCLDWDKRTLRFVVARVGRGQAKLEQAHSYRIPSGTDADDPAAMGEFIAQTLARHNIRQKRVVVDVPRDRCVINRLKLPPTPIPDLPAAVHFQALRELPFPMDEASVDYVIMERDAQRNVTEVLLAAVRRDVLDRIVKTCEAARLTPARIGLRPYANLISVNHLPAMMDRRVLFLDVGPTMTEIDVMRGETLAFSRAASVSVPFASGQLVSEDSRISSKAELSELELADHTEQQVVGELAVEITRTLQAYRATETNAVIDQIVIAGGTGIEHALLAAVDERFGLPAMLFDPTLSLGEKESEAAKLRQFSAALGLAWGLSREGLLELNFLRPKKPVPRRQTLQRRLRVAGLAATFVLATGAAWAVTDRIKLSRALEELRGRNEPISKDLAAAVARENKLLVAGEWQDQDRFAVWMDHLLELSRLTVDPGKKMIVGNVVCNADSGVVELKLACDDWKTALEFKKRVDEFEVGGKRVFEAKLGAWSESKSAEVRFKGNVNMTVEVLELRTHVAGEKKREREWRERTRV